MQWIIATPFQFWESSWLADKVSKQRVGSIYWLSLPVNCITIEFITFSFMDTWLAAKGRVGRLAC